MGIIKVSPDQQGFMDSVSGERFVPIGSNYCAIMARAKLGAFMQQVFHLFGTDEQTLPDPLDEARRCMDKLAELNLNVIRIWLEPDEFFLTGRTFTSSGMAKLDALIDICKARGIRLSLGMHLAPCASGWKLHNFQSPHDERLLEHIYQWGHRYRNEEAIFSWTIVGEGQLPWYTHEMAKKWPVFLQYWYNDNLEALKAAWGAWPGVNMSSFEDAPIPPRNVGACLGRLEVVNPGNLQKLPDDPWAGSTWRYDWRMFIEEIGSSRVRREVKMLRDAGAQQMVTVGANGWSFPNLPAGQMTMGYVPNFYLDCVDYLCLHNYPAPQCLPGANGDPLSSEAAMQSWLNANAIMADIYNSLGKPVVMEEFSWYGGGTSNFLCPLPHRSEEDQLHYGDSIMQTTQHHMAGWMHWLHRDMPHAVDISNKSGLYAEDGQRLKPWGKRYGQWAAQLQKSPPKLAAKKGKHEMPMKALFTDDRAHENWWQDLLKDYHQRGPLHFEPVFEAKPMTDTIKDLRGAEYMK